MAFNQQKQIEGCVLDRLGNMEEAKRFFNLGESSLPEVHPTKDHHFKGLSLYGEIMIMWIIHREAEALIIGEK